MMNTRIFYFQRVLVVLSSIIITTTILIHLSGAQSKDGISSNEFWSSSIPHEAPNCWKYADIQKPWTTTTVSVANCLEANESDQRNGITRCITYKSLPAGANGSVSHLTEKRIGIVGVPLRYGQNKDGPQLGPSALRETLFQSMDAAGCVYLDNGDLEFQQSYELGESHGMYVDHNFGSGDHVSFNGLQSGNNSGCGNAMFPKTVASAVYKIESAVSKVSSARHFALTLGGDHAMVMATVEATGKVYKDLVVIHIDAHGDINTIKSSDSGHIHGAPLSFVVEDEQFQKENQDCSPFKSIVPVIKPSSLAFIGLRDLDPAEVDSIDRLNITAFTSTMVKELGPKEVVKRVFDIVNPERKRPVHVSFDIDSVDPEYAPSTGTSVSNGLTKNDAIDIAKEIARTGTLVALDIAEVNPKIRSEEAKLTVKTAVDVTMAFLSNVCPTNTGLKSGRRRKLSC